MFAILTHNSELQRNWLARAGQGFMGKVWGATESVRNYFSLDDENERLARENFELRQELASAKHKLLQFRLDTTSTGIYPGFSVHHAEIVKMSRGKQHNYIIIGKGYEDGIKEKSGVVTKNGAIGIIDAVSAHYSYAMSFQNHDISISARIGQEGGSGILVWDGIHSNGAILKEIPLQYRYERGDTIFTSGHSLIFPPDIPLGIAGNSRVVNGSTNEIDVTLFQDFSAVRFVTVAHNNSFDEIEAFGE